MIVDVRDKFKKDEKVLISCDFKASPKCKGTYLKVYKNVLKGREHNDGKDRCCYCFNSLTKTGSNNYNHKYSTNDFFFNKIDSELKAYLLGWVAGDGCLKKDGLYLEIHSDDIEILNLFNNALSSDRPIAKHPIHNTVKLIINSVLIVKDLLHHLNLDKVGKKFDKITLPNLPDELQWHFIRGLIDSDGSVKNPYVHTSPAISYCSMSAEIKNQILEFCKKNDIFGRPTGHSLRWSGSNCLKLIEKIYDNATFFLKRKKEFADIHKTWVHRKGNAVKAVKPKTIVSGYTYEPSPEQLRKILLLNKSKRKLSEHNILEIKQMLTEGKTQKEVADKFKVSQSTISNVIINKNYKEVKK